MSLAQQAIGEVAAAHEFFNRSTSGLTEAQSGYAPDAGMMTAAQMVAHTAQTIEWFIEGAFSANGFDMDFEGAMAKTNACTSLAEARAWFEKAVASAKEVLATKSDADLLAPLPPGPIMGGMPRMAVIGGTILFMRAYTVSAPR